MILESMLKTATLGSVKLKEVELRFNCPACEKSSMFSKIEGMILTLARTQLKRPNAEIYMCTCCKTIIGTDYRLPVEVHHLPDAG